MKLPKQPRLLSKDEQQTWHAIKRLSETALARVAGEIEAATGLSGSDFGILTRLEDLGGGTLLQRDLVKSLGWHKARLSHQLTRMEGRGLVRRENPTSGRGVLVSILILGRTTIATARPVHSSAIRTHVLSHLNAEEARVLVQVARRMAGDA